MDFLCQQVSCYLFNYVATGCAVDVLGCCRGLLLSVVVAVGRPLSVLVEVVGILLVQPEGREVTN